MDSKIISKWRDMYLFFVAMLPRRMTGSGVANLQQKRRRYYLKGDVQKISYDYDGYYQWWLIMMLEYDAWLWWLIMMVVYDAWSMILHKNNLKIMMDNMVINQVFHTSPPGLILSSYA